MRTVAALMLAAALALALPAVAGERLAGRAHVLDGDTIVVSGIHVRLKGVAAPEVAHFGEPGEPGGEAAKAFMVELIEGETVVCDLTQERTHGRRVGWCYRSGQDIAEALIAAGLARDCPRFSRRAVRGGRGAGVAGAAVPGLLPAEVAARPRRRLIGSRSSQVRAELGEGIEHPRFDGDSQHDAARGCRGRSRHPSRQCLPGSSA